MCCCLMQGVCSCATRRAVVILSVCQTQELHGTQALLLIQYAATRIAHSIEAR
jgi:hypothetical protein